MDSQQTDSQQTDSQQTDSILGNLVKPPQVSIKISNSTTTPDFSKVVSEQENLSEQKHLSEQELQNLLVKNLLTVSYPLEKTIEIISDNGNLETLLSKHIQFNPGSTFYRDKPNRFLISGEARAIRITPDILIKVNGFIRIIIELNKSYSKTDKHADIFGSLYPAAEIASCYLNPPNSTQNPSFPIFTIAYDAKGNILCQKHILKKWPTPKPLFKNDSKFYLTSSGPTFTREVIPIYKNDTFVSIIENMAKEMVTQTQNVEKPPPLDISKCHIVAFSRDKNKSFWVHKYLNYNPYHNKNPPPQNIFYETRLHAPTGYYSNDNSHLFTITLDKHNTFYAKQCCRLDHYQDKDINKFHVCHGYGCDVFLGWISSNTNSSDIDATATQSKKDYVLKFEFMEHSRYQYYGSSVKTLCKNILEISKPERNVVDILENEIFGDGFLPLVIDPKNDAVCFEFALQPPYFPRAEAVGAFSFFYKSKNATTGNSDEYYQFHLSKYIKRSTPPSAPKNIEKLFQKIISTLKTIHKKNYLHFDIRTPNIIYSESENVYRLIDADYLISTDNINETCLKKIPTPIYTKKILESFSKPTTQSLPSLLSNRSFIDWISLFKIILDLFPGVITFEFRPTKFRPTKIISIQKNIAGNKKTVLEQFRDHHQEFPDLEQAILDGKWYWIPLDQDTSGYSSSTTTN